MLLDAVHVLAIVDYEGRAVTFANGHDALVGCQFHPEKSGEAGLALLRRFVAQGQ